MIISFGDNGYAVNYLAAMGEEGYGKLTERYFCIEQILDKYLTEIYDYKNKIQAAAALNDILWYGDTAAFIDGIKDSWYLGERFDNSLSLSDGYGFNEDFDLTIWWLTEHKKFLHNLCTLTYSEVVEYMQSFGLEIK
jgi:hypothetical protein